MLLFFFSSRRRHTRFKCDWSSDVCSSDLTAMVSNTASMMRSAPLTFSRPTTPLISPIRLAGASAGKAPRAAVRSEEGRVGEEGRAPWGADHLKKKKKKREEED